MPGDDGQLLEFPCDFPIKMMGRDREDFHALARSLVEQHTGPVADEAVRTAASRNGRFVSVTITIRAESQAQLDAIYMDLSANDDVLVAL